MAQGRHKGRRPLRAWLLPLLVIALISGGTSTFFLDEEKWQSKSWDSEKWKSNKQVEAATHIIELPTAVDATMNSTKEELCKPFADLKITCSVVFQVDATTPVGGLIEQTPPAGESATEVKLFYSRGPVNVTVPILAGLTRPEAREAVWATGLTLGTVKEVEAAVTKGVIISSSLDPSTSVANGAVINLTYSSGKITVPDWTGKSKEFVAAEAREKGIKVVFKTRLSDGTAGVVITQGVVEKKVKFSKPVTVFISKAKDTEATELPDVVGMSQTEAISILASEGFLKISIVVKSGANGKGTVVSMSPEAGKEMDPAKQITITVEK